MFFKYTNETEKGTLTLLQKSESSATKIKAQSTARQSREAEIRIR